MCAGASCGKRGGVATLDGRARRPLREETDRPPRPPAVVKAESRAAGHREREWVHLRQVFRQVSRADPTWTSEDGRCGKMLRERTVRLQYGSRVEAVYVLGTYLWTDVYR